MKGFVLTPDSVVDVMVEKLFRSRPPSPEARLLDPGCGTGAFIAGVIRWCEKHRAPLPTIVGLDSDPRHVALARERFATFNQVEVRQADFLEPPIGRYDFVIGNPPYVPITALTEAERTVYRRRFATAKGRFDLYLLFFEQALGVLCDAGRLVFVTPEKFLYVDTARQLRTLLASFRIEELCFLNEQTFGRLTTYPLISTVSALPPASATQIVDRAGRPSTANLPATGASWLPTMLGAEEDSQSLTLGDLCVRISCGVATGADAVFVVRDEALEPDLRVFAHPTVAGRELKPGHSLERESSLLVPYTNQGKLIGEAELGPLADYLGEPARKARLMARTCVARKPWYAFHESPPLRELLRPKLLCKDIIASPFFVADRVGTIVPRHSVYYLIPRDPSTIDVLLDYLNSMPVRDWLANHCQRAANGFLRLQSHVLKRLPVPQDLIVEHTVAQPALATANTP